MAHITPYASHIVYLFQQVTHDLQRISFCLILVGGINVNLCKTDNVKVLLIVTKGKRQPTMPEMDECSVRVASAAD